MSLTKAETVCYNIAHIIHENYLGHEWDCKYPALQWGLSQCQLTWCVSICQDGILPADRSTLCPPFELVGDAQAQLWQQSHCSLPVAKPELISLTERQGLLSWAQHTWCGYVAFTWSFCESCSDSWTVLVCLALWSPMVFACISLQKTARPCPNGFLTLLQRSIFSPLPHCQEFSTLHDWRK